MITYFDATELSLSWAPQRTTIDFQAATDYLGRAMVTDVFQSDTFKLGQTTERAATLRVHEASMSDAIIFTTISDEL